MVAAVPFWKVRVTTYTPVVLPAGIRVGSPSVTTQGMGVSQMKEVATLIGRAVREPEAADQVRAGVDALVREFPAYPAG